jgi:hypothetical protein
MFNGVNWTWISGTKEINDRGNYGAIGEPSPDYYPGARVGTVFWIDSSGNIFLYSGYGYAEQMDTKPASYGTKGQPDASNYPVARSLEELVMELMVIICPQYIDDEIEQGILNDFWKMVPTCFGFPLNKSVECSGMGRCIAENVCECISSIGIECETPNMFWIST